MSNADFVSRKLTFSWSTELDCVALLHYNIQASNCGSCTTTTNHTNVTCTDVPTNNSVCIFTVQIVVCGNVSGQMSNPVRVSVNIANSTVTLFTGLIVSTVSPILLSHCDCSRLIQIPKLHYYWYFAPNNTTSSSNFAFETRQENLYFHTYTFTVRSIPIMFLNR